MKRLMDIASVIRSKNSGPFELTLDIIFKTKEDYERFTGEKILNPELLQKLYRIRPEEVLSIVEFPQAKAVKATIVRPIASGNVGERDVYGAQQHGPLMELVLPGWD